MISISVTEGTHEERERTEFLGWGSLAMDSESDLIVGWIKNTHIHIQHTHTSSADGSTYFEYWIVLRTLRGNTKHH